MIKSPNVDVKIALVLSAFNSTAFGYFRLNATILSLAKKFTILPFSRALGPTH